MVTFVKQQLYYGAEGGVANIFRVSHIFRTYFTGLYVSEIAVKYKKQQQPLEVFCKKSYSQNFANFTGKHLCCSLFLIKLQVFRLQHRRFHTKFCEIFKNTYFEEHPLTTASREASKTFANIARGLRMITGVLVALIPYSTFLRRKLYIKKTCFKVSGNSKHATCW